MVAFVREGNIFIKKFEFDTEVQVTSDAVHNKVMNGITTGSTKKSWRPRS